MKAKDLRGKNIEDIDDATGEPREDDAVAAAYENISKKLESIRSGKSADDSGEPEKDETDEPAGEVELEEWKGPKPPVLTRDEPEEEEYELKKVNLRNLEDDEETKGKKEDEEEAIEDLEDEDEKNDKGDVEDEKEWEPKADDPLDDEADEDENEKEEIEDKEEMSAKDVDPEPTVVGEEEIEEKESLHSEIRRPEASESELPEDRDIKRGEEPDTLDDLAEESPFAQRNENRRSEVEELPYNQDAAPYAEGKDKDQEEGDYAIPSLKGPRQEGGNMGYNANPKGESVGQSYSPKGNYMEGNDPNNFFSQHQPQTPKRANKFHLLVLVIIGVAVIGFTVYILKGGFGGINLGTTQPSPSPSATATPEPTPIPTPEPEVNRGDFTIRVLNGTSTSGLAKTVSDKLKETGYKTANPGNASDNDVEQTEIRVKEGSESATLFERLKMDLAPDYDATEGEKLDEKSANDAEVIVGAK